MANAALTAKSKVASAWRSEASGSIGAAGLALRNTLVYSAASSSSLSASSLAHTFVGGEHWDGAPFRGRWRLIEGDHLGQQQLPTPTKSQSNSNGPDHDAGSSSSSSATPAAAHGQGSAAPAPCERNSSADDTHGSAPADPTPDFTYTVTVVERSSSAIAMDALHDAGGAGTGTRKEHANAPTTALSSKADTSSSPINPSSDPATTDRSRSTADLNHAHTTTTDVRVAVIEYGGDQPVFEGSIEDFKRFVDVGFGQC